MRNLRFSFLVVITLTAAAGCGTKNPPATVPAVPAIPAGLSSQYLAETWDRERVSWPVPPLIRHADVESRLKEVRAAAPDLFRLEEIGKSVEGRSINHIWFGRGAFHVLLWSQMHGDEPTATSALFDVFEQFRRHRDEPAFAFILDSLTIHAVPMLNPDGAERFQRRNAQGIDINRDALRLQTPEGRALKALRDRLNAPVGFNLHNQGWRTSAGKTGQPAAISLLSVAFDEARTESPGRILTKQLCALIRDALEPLAPGRIARYDDEFEVRAFGDNLTRWGTSVVLIETGPWPAAEPDVVDGPAFHGPADLLQLEEVGGRRPNFSQPRLDVRVADERRNRPRHALAIPRLGQLLRREAGGDGRDGGRGCRRALRGAAGGGSEGDDGNDGSSESSHDSDDPLRGQVQNSILSLLGTIPRWGCLLDLSPKQW